MGVCGSRDYGAVLAELERLGSDFDPGRRLERLFASEGFAIVRAHWRGLPDVTILAMLVQKEASRLTVADGADR